MMSSVEKKMRDQQNQRNEPNEPKGKIGETVIDVKPNSGKQSNKNAGDYVDFEEVED
jgi:hypothetical protein